jgi:integrase
VRRLEVAWHAIHPVLGSKRLLEIAPFDLEHYRRQRKQEGRSDVTINRALAFLRNLYTMANTWGKAAGNPVKKVRFAREHNGRMRILTPEEETEWLAHYGPQLRPLVITVSPTEFRVSELLSLTWEDVNFRRRKLIVWAAYVKNGESCSMPMNEVLTATLQPVRMSAAADSPVFRTCMGVPYRSF